MEGNGVLDLNRINYSTAVQSREKSTLSASESLRGKLSHQEPVYYAPVRSQGELDMRPSYSRRGKALEKEIQNVQEKTMDKIREEAVASPSQIRPDQLQAQQPAEGESALKQEYQTHLRGTQLVDKTHPLIALRGQLDLFDCFLIEAQILSEQQGEKELVKELEEIGKFARDLMLAEVRQEPFKFEKLIGHTPEELREMSHHPEQYFGVRHMPLDYRYGGVYAKLQLLRAKAREVELYAERAFIQPDGSCLRKDIVQALNRLSSALYILACRIMAKTDVKMVVPIGISNRHLHLSQEDMEILFGAGVQLTPTKNLSQPGQFAAQESVNLVGPKGTIENVRVLGPVRKATQVEVSGTDCRTLGIKPVVRDSGQIEGSEGITLVGPKGQITLPQGVIVASRHLHLNNEQGAKWGLKDGQKVSIKVEGERPVTFEDVLVRVGPNNEMEFHIDVDEANAALTANAATGIILGV